MQHYSQTSTLDRRKGFQTSILPLRIGVQKRNKHGKHYSLKVLISNFWQITSLVDSDLQKRENIIATISPETSFGHPLDFKDEFAGNNRLDKGHRPLTPTGAMNNTHVQIRFKGNDIILGETTGGANIKVWQEISDDSHDAVPVLQKHQ